MRWRTNVLIACIIAIGIGDAILKVWALTSLPSDESANLNSWLALAVHRNPGIAFDIPLPLVIVLPITLILVCALGYLAIKRRQTNPEQTLSAAAAIVGALGNGVDRLINGFTTDYLILFKTSAINLSDVLILLGIVGILWYDKRIPNPAPLQDE